MNEKELSAVRGRLLRCRLLFYFFLLMIPVSALGSCLSGLLLPQQSRAFVILPTFIMPVIFIILAVLVRRPIRAAAVETAVINWADENGLQFQRRAKAAASDDVYKMGGLNEHRFHMTGEVDGTKVDVVNRHTETGVPGVVKVIAEQTEITLVAAVPAEWDFVLIPKNEMGEVNDITRGERIRFRDDPDFDDDYIIYSEKPNRVQNGLPDRFVERCLKRPEYTVIVRNGTLVVFQFNYVCSPEGYDTLLSHALALASRLK